MPRIAHNTMRAIVADILLDQKELIIPEIVFINFIKKNAGLDPKTVKRYYDWLQEYKFAKQQSDGKFLITR